MRLPCTKRESPLDKKIHDVLNDMRLTSPDSEGYSKLMTMLERLYVLKASESRKPVSSDTIAIILGNLAGILVIVAYERTHVITSKGFNQIVQPKPPPN